MKVKLLAIYHNANDRDGNPYLSKKDGKPYEKCTLKDAQGYIYGFGNSATHKWKAGDEVEVEVSQNGQYRNFRLPPKNVTREEFNLLAQKVKFLEDEVEYLHSIIAKGDNTNGLLPDEPKEEVDLGELEQEIDEAV